MIRLRLNLAVLRGATNNTKLGAQLLLHGQFYEDLDKLLYHLSPIAVA